MNLSPAPRRFRTEASGNARQRFTTGQRGRVAHMQLSHPIRDHAVAAVVQQLDDLQTGFPCRLSRTPTKYRRLCRKAVVNLTERPQ